MPFSTSLKGAMEMGPAVWYFFESGHGNGPCDGIHRPAMVSVDRLSGRRLTQ
ncbi:hypothetical protein DPMN_101572 [Dreissena polymorpha]|uniref:Uncharacterized protein n=1 Tax=Dreissena polymorpha TaxID=45954 RepID=A0A9D4LK59_DREPO|nr:hypothetical protein DPMN_101572 [Dreissena polymorpha]